MRSIKVMGCIVMTALGLASSASAANWDPANTNITGHGVLTLTSGTATVTCTTHMTVSSTGNDLATTVGVPTFSACTDNIIHSSDTTVTSSAAWTATATTTTAVDVVGNGVIKIGTLCTITATAAVADNGWSNATHTLTANNMSSFDITRHGLCAGTQTTATMSGSVQFNAGTIT